MEIIDSIDLHTLKEISALDSRNPRRLEPLWNLIIFHMKENLGKKYSFSILPSTATQCFAGVKYNIVIKKADKIVGAFETSFSERSLDKNTRNGIQGRIGKCSDFRNKNKGAVYTTVSLFSEIDKTSKKTISDDNISAERLISASRGHDGMPDYSISAVISLTNETVVPSFMNNSNKRYLRQSNLTTMLEEISNVIKDRNEK